MVSTVADAAALLHAIAGPDPNDPTASAAAVPDYTATLKEDIRGLRLGVPQEYFFEDIEPAVARGCRRPYSISLPSGRRSKPSRSPAFSMWLPARPLLLPRRHTRFMPGPCRTRSQDYGADVRTRCCSVLVCRPPNISRPSAFARCYARRCSTCSAGSMRW